MSSSVDILLATYNGDRYLHEQIESILRQSYEDWRLLIRDDGSSDATLSIIRLYQKSHPEQIFLIEDEDGRVGVSQSFSRLVQSSESSYVAFCDQDDIWLPEKLSQQIELMLKKESEGSVIAEHIPVLIHSDLRVIDQDKNVIAKSFWRYQKYAPESMCSVNSLLIQNHVTGCTVLVNRALIEIACPFPEKVVMHDWWLALIAICKGEIVAMDTTTVLYRQHPDNDTGAKQWGLSYVFKIIGTGRSGMNHQLIKTFVQAQALLDRLPGDDRHRELIERYVSLFGSSWLMRRLSLLRHGFFKFGFIRNIAVFLSI